jgi:hypothetical protein
VLSNNFKELISNQSLYHYYLRRFSNYSRRCIDRLDYKLETIACLTSLPTLSKVDRQVINSLKKDGVCVTSLERLNILNSDRLLESAKQAMVSLPSTLSPDLTKKWYIGNHANQIGSASIATDHPDIYLWGLQQKLLTLVTHYIYQPITYLSVNLRRDIVNGQQVGTRVWHRDGEDHRMLKIIIYLNDTDQDGGPFEYIPKAMTPGQEVLSSSASLMDEEMARLVPKQLWKACPGSAGTVIFADTAAVWHHGKVPQQDRYSLFFTYTSRRPRWIEPYLGNFKPENAQRLLAPLSLRQRRYVLWDS